MEYTKYSEASLFVRKYAMEEDGLPDEISGANLIDTAEKVVLIDALLRKHYDALSEYDLQEITGLNEAVIRAALDDFQRADVVTLEDSMFTINNTNSIATSLREHQLDLLKSE